MTLLDKEPVRRVGRIIREFDQNLSVSVLETSARTALEAASSLGCEVGAIVKSLLFKTDNKFSLFFYNNKVTKLVLLQKILLKMQ